MGCKGEQNLIVKMTNILINYKNVDQNNIYVDQNDKYFDRNDKYQVWLESRPKKDHIACSPNVVGKCPFKNFSKLWTHSLTGFVNCVNQQMQKRNFVILIDLPLSFRPT